MEFIPDITVRKRGREISGEFSFSDPLSQGFKFPRQGLFSEHPVFTSQQIMNPAATFRKRRKVGPVVRAIRRKRNVMARIMPKPLAITERKELLTNLAATNLSQDANIIQILNGVAQGNTDNNRVGNQFLMKAVFIKGIITPVGGTNSVARIVLLLDKQPNGAVPVLQGASSATQRCYNTSQWAPLDQLDQNNRMRYVVLREIVAIPIVPFGNANQPFYFEWYVRFPNGGFTVQCNGTGATIASIASNSLYLCGTSSLLAASSPPTLTASAKIIFQDP